MAGVDDTRGSERIPTAVQVTFEVHESMKESIPFSAKKFTSHISDISTVGCAILSHTFFPKNVLLNLEIDAALFYPNESGRVVKAAGRVCNCRNFSKDSYRLGVSFEKIAPEDKQAIKRFIESNERRKEKRFNIEPPPETPKPL